MSAKNTFASSFRGAPNNVSDTSKTSNNRFGMLFSEAASNLIPLDANRAVLSGSRHFDGGKALSNHRNSGLASALASVSCSAHR